MHYILTGVEGFSFGVNAVSIVPNPAKEQIRVNYNVPENGTIQISIFEMSGIEALNITRVVELGGLGEIQLNTGSLNSGCYILQFKFNGTGNEYAVHKKLVIN